MEQGRPVYDMLIVGGGPAGYTAALYAARAGLKAVVLEKLSPGGQMALSTQVDNYPGFPEGIDGFSLAELMQQQAERFGASTEFAEVTSADLTADPKALETSEGPFYGRTVVIAAGAGPRELGLPGEKELTGRGVAYCAACEGMFFKGKTVAVIGGGNSAAADALLLSRVAGRVMLVHRRDQLRADKIYHKPLEEASNVEFCWDCVPQELLQKDGRLCGLRLKNVKTGEIRALECDGVFISVGRVPASALFAGQLACDKAGYIIAGEDTATSLPGVFAAGDVRTKDLRQVITAAADGAMAVHSAEAFLAAQR